MASFRRLPGLPPYGEPARPFPASWGRSGREGVVVEFLRADGRSWVGNFAASVGGFTAAVRHPDGRRVLVVGGGDVWSIDPETAAAEVLSFGVEALWPVRGPDGFVMSLSGLALLRLGPAGVLWHTRRLSWDGFDDIQLSEAALIGQAWSPLEGRWMPFEVDLATGASQGGSFGPGDAEGWERLARPRDAG